MAVLAIDTSSAISVALLDNGEVRAHQSAFEPRSHAELLAAMVHSVLDDAEVSGTDVTRVVVGRGPAPFTGLRVGLMTARTLARAWDVPVEGVCSLDALGVEHGGDVTAIADARRREVYWARYESGVRVDGPHVTSPSEVVITGGVCGRGAQLYAGALGVERVYAPIDPDPARLVDVADSLKKNGDDALDPEPLYLRRPDVHGAPAS